MLRHLVNIIYPRLHTTVLRKDPYMIYICNTLLALNKKQKQITCNTSQNLPFKAWPPCKSPCQITCRNNGASWYECSTLSLEWLGTSRFHLRKKNSSKTKLCCFLRVSADGSCAGGPNMHLFCYLVHVTNVRSLIWIRVYAHADQLPQLKDRKQA